MATSAAPEPAELVLPDYAGACLSNLVPALARRSAPAPWLPEPLVGADQVVLLVLDGLGWLQLQERAALAPTLSAMAGGPITSVVPSTTATALTSITFGAPPASHGVVGYRVRVDADVLNVLRWTTAAGDARPAIAPREFADGVAFGGRPVPVVTRLEFAGTGFTDAHLGGARLAGWSTPSGIAVEVARLLASGEELVYAYYDGVDTVSHLHGFGAHYDAELRAADRLVEDLLAVLPAGAALVVTADHGQVEVGDRLLAVPASLLDGVVATSGEARFRWLHAGGRAAVVAGRLADHYEAAGTAWVRTRDQAVAEGWFGGPLGARAAARVGDVALVARAPVGFADDADRGSHRLVCRHGSLTPAEMLVPLLAARA